MTDYVLGLDLGSNSIGWAAIAQEGQTFDTGRRITAGVRVFPEGLEQPNTKREKPRGQQRREARGARRVHQRRAKRKRALRRILQEAGMLPSFPAPQKTLPALWKTEPYALRAKALDEPLSLAELGRVLHHLCERRGFKSNRKAGTSGEEGKIKKATAELQAKIDACGARTLGEYLAGLAASERIRDRYTLRAMYEHEFECIWAAQAVHHPEVLTAALKEAVSSAIFYQRPITWNRDSIGDCELEPGEKRAPTAHWLVQQFRVLQEVNNLRVLDEGGEERPLTADERAALVRKLATVKSLTFAKMRQLLRLEDWQTFNLETLGKRTKLTGNLAGAALTGRTLKKWYAALSDKQREEVHDALAEIEDEDALRQQAREQWKCTDAQAEALAKIKLPTGRSHLSLKAVRKILPHLEEGCDFSEAKRRSGYALSRNVPTLDKLPPVDDDQRSPVANLTNPLVHRGLTETRKVVNALVAAYGPPREVVIELGRDLKNAKQRRREIHFDNLKHRKENDEARTRLIQEFDIANPSRDDVIRYNLWEECGRECPYTGRSIGKTALFSGDFQVEHILPYSRTLDDSYMNKTLCAADENRTRKHNKTPYEAYHDDPDTWDGIRRRIRRLPRPKQRRFTQSDVTLDNFVARQLNDTRYLSRAARDYLRVLGCGVRCVKGQTTAELRHQWGLDLVEGLAGPVSKAARTDHRHHAVDAAVIAMTTRSALQHLSTVKYGPQRTPLDPPWEGFRDDVTAAVEDIRVSYRPQRKIAGALHEETAYGPAPDGGVVRKPVAELSVKEIERIRDGGIQRIVREAVYEAAHAIGREPKGSDKVGALLGDRELAMPSSGVPIRKVRIVRPERTLIVLTRDAEGKPIKLAKPGGNHHAEIFEKPDGSWTGRVISRWKAHTRLREQQPVVRRDADDGSTFIMSLCINDMVELEGAKPDAPCGLYRVQMLSLIDGRPYFVFRLHTAARIDDDTTMARAQSWGTFKSWHPRKVLVDPLGRMHPCND